MTLRFKESSQPQTLNAVLSLFDLCTYWELIDNLTTITINPPLRARLPISWGVFFGIPRIIFRLGLFFLSLFPFSISKELFYLAYRKGISYYDLMIVALAPDKRSSSLNILFSKNDNVKFRFRDFDQL